MKIFLVTTFIFLSLFTKAQFWNPFLTRTRAVKVSDVKNIQPVSTDATYEAFGALDSSRTNKLTYWFRRGSAHVGGGNPYYREFNIVANHWYDPVQISNYEDTLDARDVSGGRMDNDSVVIFYTRNHTDIYHTRDIFIQKGDSNNHFSAPVAFNWTGILQLQSGFFYGQMAHGANPGEYYMALYQFNTDTGTRPHYHVSCIKTTDYWAHYIEAGVIFDGTIQFSETCIAYLGGSKMLALMRDNQGGELTPVESTNSGVTWTRRNFINLYWFIQGGSEMANILVHDGLFDVIYQCRDAKMVHISANNDPSNAAVFGTANPVYNNPEIYSHHLGTGGNPSLGYPTIHRLPNGHVVTIYAKQLTDLDANIMWTRDDFLTDPDGTIPPPPPSLGSNSITSTTFQVTIDGYTDKQLENIRYMQMDISTSPTFASFVTAKYRNVGTFPASVIQNIRVLGLFDNISVLTTATTYYIRIKACNNLGCSAYTTINVTTL